MRNRKGVFAVLSYVVGAIILLPLLNFLLADDVSLYSRAKFQDLYAASGQIDTLFLGASHCLDSIDPLCVDDLLGVNSFNLGSTGQMPNASYYLLREAAQENPLRTVYLEVYYGIFVIDGPEGNGQSYFELTDFMKPTSLNRYLLQWEAGGGGAIPDLIFPVRHLFPNPGELPRMWRAKLGDGYKLGNYEYINAENLRYDYKKNGFLCCLNSMEGEMISGKGEKIDPDAPISLYALNNLLRITDYCEENGIRLVLFTAPMPDAFMDDVENYQTYIDFMRNFAAEHHSAYWDFNLWRDGEEMSLTASDFYDSSHLNGKGAEIFTSVFCEVVKQERAGKDVSALFFDTLEEKLVEAPDGTLAGIKQKGGRTDVCS